VTVVNSKNNNEHTILIYDGDNLQRVAERVGKAAGMLGM